MTIMKTLKYCSKIKQNIQNINGNTAFMIACKHSTKIEMIEELIKNTDVHKKNYNGNNALMLACKNSRFDFIDVLVKKGININERNNKGNTALMICCIKENIKYAEKLIKFDCDVNIQNKDGYTALMLECENDEIEKSFMLNLIGSKININLKNDVEQTAFKIYVEKFGTSDRIIMKAFVNAGTEEICEKEYINKLLKLKDEEINNKLYEANRHNSAIILNFLSTLSKETQEEWYEFIVDKKRINKSIIKHRNYIYEKPENIISMCGEVIFNQKQQKYSVPDKLKFLFDIKNETDCMGKIKFYLEN